MSSINVSLINAASAKAQTVCLPRDMTVAELQKLAPNSGRGLTFTVDGCAPAPATALGDLFDMCAKNEQLQVTFSSAIKLGGLACAGPCCSVAYNPSAGLTTQGDGLINDNPGLIPSPS